MTLDLTTLPTSTGVVTPMPGESWIFQAWHRDGQAQSSWNYSDAVRITFE